MWQKNAGLARKGVSWVFAASRLVGSNKMAISGIFISILLSTTYVRTESKTVQLIMCGT
jgi:hypothetical protein